jgi:hypothetical protein
MCQDSVRRPWVLRGSVFYRRGSHRGVLDIKGGFGVSILGMRALAISSIRTPEPQNVALIDARLCATIP